MAKQKTSAAGAVTPVPEVKLIKWYREEVRGLLEGEALSPLDGLDRAAEMLEVTVRRPSRICVGFLGESQVGKSSLINSLVGQMALPAGGVGPLTAQATTVTRSEGDRRIEVKYHGRTELNRLRFSLERAANRPSSPAPDNEDAGDDGAEEEAEPGKATVKQLYMVSQAQSLFSCAEDVPLAVLIDGLRSAAQDRENEKERPPLPEDIQKRADEIAALLETSESLSEQSLGGRKEFNAALHLRAAGWMSPLVAQLDVALDSELVRSVDLVDLPGIGVVADPAGKVAEQFVVSQKGQALVVVMRNSGVTETLAQMLEKTGVITRLLFGGRDGHQPIHVLVAITHLDDVARTHFQEAQRSAKESGHKPPDRHAVFAELARQMEVKLRSQLREALRSSEALEGLAEEPRKRRMEVIDELCRRLVVSCVAAPDFLAIQEGFEDDAFLKRADATNVPGFRQTLIGLAKATAEERQKVVNDACLGLADGIETHLAALKGVYADGEGKATRQLDSLKQEMTTMLGDLRPQMAGFHGEALATLKEVIPRDIDALCVNAKDVARAKLDKLLRKGKELHYQSLNKAMREGGTWERRQIDYPGTLILALIDTIATEWEPTVVDAIKRTVKQLAERDIALVELLCAAARAHDDRVVVDAQIEAQQQLLDQAARSCVSWTKERLDELRTEIHAALLNAVRGEIEAACKAAVRAGRNKGAGARDKILEVFSEAGAAAVAVAAKDAAKVLRLQYNRLVKQLDDGYLSHHHDPLEAAFNALTNQELHRARRSDAKKSKRIIDQAAELLATLKTLRGGCASL